MLIIQGTIRESSLASDVSNYLLQEFPKAELLTLENYKQITPQYLQGSPGLGVDWTLHDFYVFVISSYYNFPPPVFLNWLFQLSRQEVQDIFNGKKIFIVSVQGGQNLNELPVHNIRQLFQKIWDFNDIDSYACIKHAMLSSVPDPRLLHLLRLHNQEKC